MNPAAEHLRVRIAAVPQQGPGGRRYGAELKRAVVEHAFARQGEGATIREIAEELGLSAGVLGCDWHEHRAGGETKPSPLGALTEGTPHRRDKGAVRWGGGRGVPRGRVWWKSKVQCRTERK